MLMSGDPSSKFRTILNFVLILHLISEKVTKFQEEKFPTSDVIGQKTSRDEMGWGGGGEGTPSPFRVNLPKRQQSPRADSLNF